MSKKYRNKTQQHYEEKAISIETKNQKQIDLLKAIKHNDISFAIGTAGSGKTFLAVAEALRLYDLGKITKIIIVRPAIEAGENLGFLPGTLEEKITPYLRPLYDCIEELKGKFFAEKLLKESVLEMSPLAYMRGRTLSKAFIILDEAQNSTVAQMRMFLTRLGNGSTMVITGDVTQIDLPNSKMSGLLLAIEKLQEVPGISFTFFEAKDSVRHPLVSRIINTY